MKYNVVCPICKAQTDVNGEIAAREAMLNHLQTHPQAYKNWLQMRDEVKALREQIHTISENARKGYGVSIR